MNLPLVLFKYLMETLKEMRDTCQKSRKWIPLGRLISDILVKSKLVEELKKMIFLLLKISTLMWASPLIERI